ncbi:uncharacterized protein TNCV_3013391 [Trichonephila clavipes]|nr:uncharacterized protein TNCV_3013391 [Trichonephila clavipes]
MFFVKKDFTFGFPTVKSGEIHLIQTTHVPMLIYEFPSSSLRCRVNPNFFRRSFEPYDQMLYHRMVLEPHSVYPIPAGTPFILLTVQKTVFGLDIIPEMILPQLMENGFNLGDFRKRKRFDQKAYKLPPPTPAHVPAETSKRPLEQQPGPFSKKKRVFITPVIRPPVAPVLIARPFTALATLQPVSIPEPPELTTSQVPDPPAPIPPELTTPQILLPDPPPELTTPQILLPDPPVQTTPQILLPDPPVQTTSQILLPDPPPKQTTPQILLPDPPVIDDRFESQKELQSCISGIQKILELILFATAVEENVQQTVAAAMTIVTTCNFTFRSHPPLSRKPRLSIHTDDVLVTSSTVMLRTLKNGTAALGNHSFTDDSSMDQIMSSVFGDYLQQGIPSAHTQEAQVLDTVPSLFDESNDLISFLDHFEAGFAL